MNTDELKEQLRRNLLRLWTHLGEQSEASLPKAEPSRLHQALESLFQAQNGGERGLTVSDQTPRSKLVTQVFPVGPPGLDLYRELREGDLPPDHLALAARLVIGSSWAIRQTVEVALRLAPTSVPILVTGETGVGKELFARLVHQTSAVARAPFVTVNCAAMPDTLLMAELFGYEPGSFTGAAPRGRIGKIEAADGGTLLLDEIGDLSAAGQAALLRFLDSGEVQKVGRAQSVRVTVRLICSTNCDLEKLVESGRFRKDLYYRIALVPLHVPPLRERPSDVPLLTAHFMEEFRRRHQRSAPKALTSKAMECLARYSWPGNVRELAFTLERAFLLCGNDQIELSCLPAHITRAGCARTSALYEWISARLTEARPVLFPERDRWTDFLGRHTGEPISTGDIVREFGYSEASARIRLSALAALGVLSATGNKRGRKYWLLAPSE